MVGRVVELRVILGSWALVRALRTLFLLLRRLIEEVVKKAARRLEGPSTILNGGMGEEGPVLLTLVSLLRVEWVSGGSMKSRHGDPTVDLWVAGIDRTLSDGVPRRLEITARVDEWLP